MRLIPLLLLVIPVAEIAVFILVGQWIGLGWTLLGILLTAILGSILLRRQGFATIAAIRREIDAGRVPGRELSHGLMIAVAGVLLMTPGFVTDTLGFLLFVPSLRERMWQAVRSRISVQVMGAASGHRDAFGRERRPGDPFAARPGAHAAGQPGVVDLDEGEWARREAQPTPSAGGTSDRSRG